MILDTITKITKIGIRKTIDIEVDGDHLFYCNGILTHNSAAGDTADITEENIQGGISKVQAADNVLAFIPNAQARDTGVMRAKFLKTRDSGGVGSYIDFRTEWKTLTFEPWSNENGSSITYTSNLHSNLPSQTGKNQSTVYPSKQDKPSLKRAPKKKPTAKVKSDSNEESDLTNNDEEVKSTHSVIKGIKGRNKPHQKKIKLL